MKKKVLTSLLASASVLGLCFSGTTALAAGVISDEVGETKTTIGFTGHSENPGLGDTKLSFRFVPESFDFGSTNALPSSDTDFTMSGTRYIVVRDDRTPNNTNVWTVTGQLSELKNGNNKLIGASLGFSTDILNYKMPSGGTTEPAPESHGVIGAKDQQTATTGGADSSNFSLPQGGTSAIEVMRDGQAGAGTYRGYTALGISNIKLSVGANSASEGTYEGTVTWTLKNAF